MKICMRCNETKLVTDFNFKIKEKGILQTYCKNCTRLYIQSHYKNNRQYYLQKARKRNIKLKLVIQKYLWGYLLKHSCVDCGEKDPIVLEFDHMKMKLMAVSKLISYGSIYKIQQEVKKCEVRCANCHRRKTALQYNWYKNLPL